MSHLSILPTVLRDVDCLAASLEELGLQPQRGGSLQGFADDVVAVDVQVTLSCGLAIGWQRQGGGQLALVADLQRLSRSLPLQHLLGCLTRAYAVHAALRQLASDPALAAAQVVLAA